MRVRDAALIDIVLANVIVGRVPDVQDLVVVERPAARHFMIIVHEAIHCALIVLEIVMNLGRAEE